MPEATAGAQIPDPQAARSIPVLSGCRSWFSAFVHLLRGDPVTALLWQHAQLAIQIREQMGLDKLSMSSM